MNNINIYQLSEALSKLNVPDNDLIEQINQYISEVSQMYDY